MWYDSESFCPFSFLKSESQITWYKGDSVIKQSRYFRMENDRDTFSLKISEAFPEDEGVYKCIAMNSQGSITTKANLKVTETAAAAATKGGKWFTGNGSSSSVD